MRWREMLRRPTRSAAVDPAAPMRSPAHALLAQLPGDWLLVDARDRVEQASERAADLGVVAFGALSAPELQHLVAATRTDGVPRTLDLAVGGVAVGSPPRRIRAHASHLDRGQVVLLLNDISAATRVDAMRRDFIASVADEMRGPADAILGHARQARKARSDKALGKSVDLIEAEANRLSALVGDLTDLSRLQAVDAMEAARVVDVRHCVEQAVDSVAKAARDKRIDVVRDVPEVHLLANEEQVVTALRNVLANAITYSPPHTLVTVSAALEGGQVAIAVADQGIGIPPEQQVRIFERFHRVDPARSRESGGTGLGLAIVQHICMAHGGEVTVRSEPGRGSLFTLRFPAGRKVAESSAADGQEDL